MQSPKEIYLSINRHVSAILASLAGKSDDQQLSDAQRQAHALFLEFSQSLSESIAQLEKNAEWDIFSIAFYGETNAGKSTLIETLRILLSEPVKKESQRRFRELVEQHALSERRLDELQQAFDKACALCERAAIELAEANTTYQTAREPLEAQLAELKAILEERRRTASLWQRLLSLFRQSPEQREVAHANEALLGLNARFRQILDSCQKNLDDARSESARTQSDLDRVSQAMAALGQYADGGIIGNGQSDFTKSIQTYVIGQGEQKFALMDVPGIEGKEASVMEEIWRAVRTAHAVFYVTSKAAAPQKGDGKKPGTLEKIKSHLGAQTEVRTIYNKRITNALALGKPELVSDDERDSLADLDRKMADELGDHYRGTIVVSALPAFLAAASCLVPGSLQKKTQRKFDNHLAREDVLQRSGIAEFLSNLEGDISTDYKEKIRRANFNKADQVVQDAAEKIDKVKEESFEPLANQLRKNAKDACRQLDLALAEFERKLNDKAESSIEKFAQTTRAKIYDRIDNDISNDEFKQQFADIVEERQQVLVDKIQPEFNKVIDRFQGQIEKIIDRMEEHARELSALYGNLKAKGLNSKFDLKFDIRSGINYAGLAAAAIGALTLIWNPLGWALIALGVLANVAKAVMSFFSKSYRRGQQRKAVDANLDEITRDMRQGLADSLTRSITEVKEQVGKFHETLHRPAKQVEQICALLNTSAHELNRLSHTIQKKKAFQ